MNTNLILTIPVDALTDCFADALRAIVARGTCAPAVLPAPAARTQPAKAAAPVDYSKLTVAERMARLRALKAQKAATPAPAKAKTPAPAPAKAAHVAKVESYKVSKTTHPNIKPSALVRADITHAEVQRALAKGGFGPLFKACGIFSGHREVRAAWTVAGYPNLANFLAKSGF